MMLIVMLVVAIAIAAVVALLARGLFLGYPPAALSPAALSAKEQAIVAACADALFPPGGPIPLSGTDAGLVPYMDHSVQRLPRATALLIRLLFLFIEHGPWIFGPRLARFTRLRPEERVRALRGMATSRIYFRRVAFLSLRTMLSMGYLANEAVARRIGITSGPKPLATSVSSEVPA
jgi:hypothetical protein